MEKVRFDLSGEVAVITGAGGVLCSGFAKILASSGAAVAVLDISREAAEKVAKEINDDGGKAIAVAADCLSHDSLMQARETVNRELGECTLLINGAGGNNPKATTSHETLEEELIDKDGETSFFDLDSAAFGRVFDLNVRAAVITTQVFAKDMVKAKSGNIINISSMNAFRPLTKIPAYSSAKAAVSNFTQWLSVYLAPCGVRCNAIAPGFFISKQNYDLMLNPDGTLRPRGNKIISHTPMKRFGEQEDLWGTLLWLSSKEASGFVTGIIVPVDGGFSAYSGV